MYSMAYEPRIAGALAREHIDREVGRAAARATARSSRSARRPQPGETYVDASAPARRPLRTGLTELARRAATSGARLRAHA